MEKQQNKQDKGTISVISQIIRFSGIITILIGIYVIYRSNQTQPEPSEPLWWIGLGVFVLGLHLFFFSNMPKQQIYEWLKSESIALGLALLIRWPIAEPYRIPSSSMEPTLHGDFSFGKGDRVFVNKWIYGVRFPFLNKRIWYGKKPQRWEIVVFKTVENDAKHKTLVKRVVGLPGERVHIKDGKIYINGKPLELPPNMPDIYYTSGPAGIGGMEYGIRTEDKYSLIPENCYFLLGDNSAYSRDGRFFGWVPNEHIVGRVSCIWWPPSRWRDFTGFSKTWWWKTLCLLTSIFIIIRLLFARSVVWYKWNSDKLYHYVVNQLSYGLRLPFTKIWLHTWKRPQRGDIIAYITPKGVENIPSETILCGVVIGIEGDKVSIQNDTVLINGKELTDIPFPLGKIESSFSNREAPYGLLKDKEHSLVPIGNVFVIWNFPKKEMEIAIDSRTIGWIPESNILGKLTFVWWPLHALGKNLITN